MKINKWDFKEKKYNLVDIPGDWKLGLYSNDMKEVIQCVNCGRDLLYGNSYTSRQYHTELGFGYCVCKECYEEEWKQEIDSEEQ